MTFSRPPLFSRRKALWRSSWLPLAILALLIGHATFGVRLADSVARFVSKIAHRRFKGPDRAQEVELKLQGEIWSLQQQNRDLQMQLSAQRPMQIQGSAKLSKFEHHPARIVLRDTAEWASFIWVEMAEPTSAYLLAPVVCGDVAVGIVDFTAQNRCRIRLLSDSQISLSVTVAPTQIDQQRAGDVFQNRSTENLLVGQIRGFGGALWNSSGTLLIGQGYVPNPPKDNHFDRPGHVNCTRRRFALSDQLVTSGMDGIFPPNLRVGSVDRVEPDRPGATRYAFGAISALNLHELTEIAILKKSDAFEAMVKTDES